jgi:hypothetical protein
MRRLLSTIAAENIHHMFANATALINNFNSTVGSSGLTTVIGHFGVILRKTFNRQLRGGALLPLTPEPLQQHAQPTTPRSRETVLF